MTATHSDTDGRAGDRADHREHGLDALLEGQVGRVDENHPVGRRRELRDGGVVAVAAHDLVPRRRHRRGVGLPCSSVERRRSRASSLAVSSTRTTASGATTVVMSRPSATTPPVGAAICGHQRALTPRASRRGPSRLVATADTLRRDLGRPDRRVHVDPAARDAVRLGRVGPHLQGQVPGGARPPPRSTEVDAPGPGTTRSVRGTSRPCRGSPRRAAPRRPGTRWTSRTPTGPSMAMVSGVGHGRILLGSDEGRVGRRRGATPQSCSCQPRAVRACSRVVADAGQHVDLGDAERLPEAVVDAELLDVDALASPMSWNSRPSWPGWSGMSTRTVAVCRGAGPVLARDPRVAGVARGDRTGQGRPRPGGVAHRRRRRSRPAPR